MKKEFQNKPEEDSSWGSQLIVGRNPVIEALKADKLIDTVYVNPQATGSITLICKMAKEKGITLKQVSEIKLNNMAKGASHQGVIAVGACAEYVQPERLLEIAQEKGEDPFIIICDEIEDPHNFGSIARVAECMGVDGVVIGSRRQVAVTETVVKTSAGATTYMRIAKVGNINDAIRTLKEEFITVYALDMDGTPLQEARLDGDIALVVGNEGKGVKPLTRKLSDGAVSIPMYGNVASLNASVAAGIAVYEANRQRK